MASEKQDRANRLNAQKSTGPKTPQGRAAVRLNVAKHGILSKDSLLPGEDEAAFLELAEPPRAELRPARGGARGPARGADRRGPPEATTPRDGEDRRLRLGGALITTKRPRGKGLPRLSEKPSIEP